MSRHDLAVIPFEDGGRLSRHRADYSVTRFRTKNRPATEDDWKGFENAEVLSGDDCIAGVGGVCGSIRSYGVAASSS